MIPDPLSAIRTALGLDAAVVALVPANRIFVGELPATEASAMPRTAVVLSYAGGSPELGLARLTRPRIDVRCYGTLPLDAQRLSWEVHASLKLMIRRVVAASSSGERSLIHGVTPAGGPVYLRDPQGDWPFVFRSYDVVASEVLVP